MSYIAVVKNGVFHPLIGQKVYYGGSWHTLSATDSMFVSGKRHVIGDPSDISNVRDDRGSFLVRGFYSISCLYFSSNGFKMYVCGTRSCGSDSFVYQYALSAAWDISTVSNDNISFGPGLENVPHYTLDGKVIITCLHFSPDGLKMYVAGIGDSIVYQYALSTAWDISTASYSDTSFYHGSEDVYANGLFFSPDGLKLYIGGNNHKTIYQYTLSTAWDISTASYSDTSFYHGLILAESPLDTICYGPLFSPDGLKMYMATNVDETIYQYTLSTAWDVSTASYHDLYRGRHVGNLEGLYLNFDVQKMYTLVGVQEMHQYSIIA